MLAEEGRLLEALQAFPEAVRLAPDDPYIRIEYAELLLRVAQRYGAGTGRMERMDEAAQQAAVARRLAPENLDAQRALGRIELSLADFRPEAMADAIEALEVVRKRAPDDVQTMVTLGQIYLQQRQADRAAEVFGEAAAYTPGNRMIYSFLADALHAAGRDDEAEEPQRKLLELDPRALDARLGLAKSLAEKGDHRGAVALLRAGADGGGREPRAPRRAGLAALPGRRLRRGAGDGGRRCSGRRAERRLAALRARPRRTPAQGKNDEALAELDALRADDPDNLELARDRRRGARAAGASDEAAAQSSPTCSARLDAGGDDKPPSRAAGCACCWPACRRGRASARRRWRPWSRCSTATDGDVQQPGADRLRRPALRPRPPRARRSPARGGGRRLPALRAKEIELLLRAGDDKRAQASCSPRCRRATTSTSPCWPPRRRSRRAAGSCRCRCSSRRSPPAPSGSRSSSWRGWPTSAPAGATGGGPFRTLLAINPDFAPALNYLGYMWASAARTSPRRWRWSSRRWRSTPTTAPTSTRSAGRTSSSATTPTPGATSSRPPTCCPTTRRSASTSPTSTPPSATSPAPSSSTGGPSTWPPATPPTSGEARPAARRLGGR